MKRLLILLLLIPILSISQDEVWLKGKNTPIANGTVKFIGKDEIKLNVAVDESATYDSEVLIPLNEVSSIVSENTFKSYLIESKSNLNLGEDMIGFTNNKLLKHPI